MMRFDLHVHSKYSFDSKMDPKTIIKVARRKNLNGLAITDHNTIMGGKKVHEENESPLLIIVGSEISTDIGDIVGLFLVENIRSKDCLEVLDEVKSQGGISVFPHPFKGHELTHFKTRKALERIDCVEILSSRAPITEKEHNYLASLGKSLVASSDAHFPSEIGLCRTLLKTNTRDPEHIRKLILTGRTFVTGTYGPRYFQTMSQLVKDVKLKRFHSLAPHTFLLIEQMLKEKQFWSK